MERRDRGLTFLIGILRRQSEHEDVPRFAGRGTAVALVLRLQPVHQQVLALLGPSYEELYKFTN